MAEDMEARMTAQIESRMTIMEARMVKMHKASWNRKELVVEEKVEVEDLGDDKETDNGYVSFIS